jgi:hypothetical protein
MIGISDKDIVFLDGSPGSKERVILSEMAKFPEEHDGKVVFVKDVGGQPLGPFVRGGIFYFNDKGEWYTLEEARNVK